MRDNCQTATPASLRQPRLGLRGRVRVEMQVPSEGTQAWQVALEIWAFAPGMQAIARSVRYFWRSRVMSGRRAEG